MEAFARFALVGAVNTLIDTGAYFILTCWFALDVAPAKGIAYALGMFNSYIWNRAWTFQSRLESSRSVFRFPLAQISALAINTTAMHLLLQVWGLAESVSLALATIASLGWNFLLNRYFVFPT